MKQAAGQAGGISASGAVAEPSGASVSGTAADADSAESAAAEEPAVASVAADSAQGTSSDVNLYRLYNPNSGEHFYTSSLAVAGSVATAGWRWEGVGWVEPAASSAPVWRLYNPNAGDHHYTLSAYERDWLVSLGWRAEGTGWYSAGSSDGAPVWRLYNPNAVAGAHHYTLSASERDWLVSLGWRSEGVGFYASSSATLPVEPFWLVTAAWGSLERYWVQSDGSVAVSRLVSASEGAGWDAYARPSGAVVRGKWDDGAGHVYVADNDGRLASTADGGSGWIVTGVYDGGVLQRYWYDAGSHAMLSGFFSADGSRHFGVAGQGYVLRGRLQWGDHVLLADNDGRLASGEGWLVTGAYDDGTLQRYWLEHVVTDFSGARTGLFSADGSRYYGVPGLGYVLRNDYVQLGSTWYRADNDGVLTETLPPLQQLMLARAQGFSSRTNWLVLVNRADCKVAVLSGAIGNWSLQYFWDCTPGKPSTPMITGTFRTGIKKLHLNSTAPARYCTQISGAYYFHTQHLELEQRAWASALAWLRAPGGRECPLALRQSARKHDGEHLLAAAPAFWTCRCNTSEYE